MKPLLTRSNSSPHNFVKRSHRPSPISPYHFIHHHPSESGDGVSSGGGFVGGWLGRRGSVPNHRQGASKSQDSGGGGIGNQSRSPANCRKGWVAQQVDDAGGKQMSGQSQLRMEDKGQVIVAGAGNPASGAITSVSTKGAKEVAEDLAKVRKHKAAMEEMSHSIQRLEASAGQHILQLSDTYECVIGKLEELQAITMRFAELQKLTAELVDNLTANEKKVVTDIGGQIQSLGMYQDEVDKIRMLQSRLDLQRRAVENYKARLETVEEKISRQKELEVVWRQRASRRLRILWGMISVLVIIWLLATSTHDGYLSGADDGEEVDEQPPEQQFMEGALGVKFEYGSLPKEVLSLEADRLLRERRHHHDEP